MLKGSKEYKEAEAMVERELQKTRRKKAGDGLLDEGDVVITDFWADLESGNFLYVKTQTLFPSKSVNAKVKQVEVGERDGEKLKISATSWLMKNRSIVQRTWVPGEPKIIHNKLMRRGQLQSEQGVRCYNFYDPPIIEVGDPSKAGPWLELLQSLYPHEHKHLLSWFAQRVQQPEIKCNQAVVMSGAQGIGKDTLLVPVRYAIGHWNCAQARPEEMMGQFNAALSQAVILCINEARDLGGDDGRRVDRYSFYERMKNIITAPPDFLVINPKHANPYEVPNLVGVIITTNHFPDGLYLPPDDRRHFVCHTTLTRDARSDAYWTNLHQWLATEGNSHVAAYLNSLDIMSFNPKAPPPRTDAFHQIVAASRSPMTGALADALDHLGTHLPGGEIERPAAITLAMLRSVADGQLLEELIDLKRHSRIISARLAEARYVTIHKEGTQDGLWTIHSARQAIYVRDDLSENERHKAAYALQKQLNSR